MVQVATRVQAEIKAQTRVDTGQRFPVMRVGIIVLLACLGMSWFMYQLLLVPQPTLFAPPWQGAQWVQATDGNGPVAYFRYTTALATLPDAAFVTLSANQVYRLYVNNVFVGSNMQEIGQGGGLRAHIYDVLTALQPGANAISVRVANIDRGTPLLRASFGVVYGTDVTYHGTSADWLATAQSSLVYPRYATRRDPWTATNFQEVGWRPARATLVPLSTPLAAANPLLYEHALPYSWMSAGGGQDAYFVRSLVVPAGYTNAWMRVVAAGPADIFINGQHVIVWNGQVPIHQQQVINYLSSQETVVQYRKGLVLGVYNLSPYLRAGTNIIAVHVSAPGNSAAQVGLEGFTAALLLDMLLSDGQNHNTWVTPDNLWHASGTATAGWEQGALVLNSWPAPALVGRPGVSRIVYLPDDQNPNDMNVPPLSGLEWLVLLCVAAVLITWLGIAFLCRRVYGRSFRKALALFSLAYLPALACEGLLIVIGLEPQVWQPFPYTWFWGSVLLGVILMGFVLVWLHARGRPQGSPLQWYESASKARSFIVGAIPRGRPGWWSSWNVRLLPKNRLRAWLRLHWGLVAIVLVACVLSCYGLNYEPYWQDELTSYYAAKGVLAHGLPTLLSGFLYTKAELYSYMLALFMLIFGDQNGMPRLLSVIEYLCSLVILYEVARRMFQRRIALLATALLAFAPSSLLWGHEVRMYEQAQLLYIVVLYLFYRAVQQPHESKRVYLAVAALVVMYLSHEESFIVLPSLVLYALIGSWDRRAGRPVVLFLKDWWIAACAGASIILVQLLLTKVTHPPILGTDQTQQPFIQLTVENIPYYFRLLFWPSALQASQPRIMLSTLLALLGGVMALRQKDRAAIYCSLLFWGPILVLVFLFTLTSDRYIYPILPSLYLMSAYTLQKLWHMLRDTCQVSPASTMNPRAHLDSAINRRAHDESAPMVEEYTASRGHALPGRVLLVSTMMLLCASVFILPVLPLSNYNLFVSRQLGLLYHRHYPDYDNADSYLRQHMRPGDVVVAVSPAISVVYYVGRVDYFFSINRALYLFEEDGRITDTPTGTTPLLNQGDFQAVLNMHNRVWIISDNGIYQAGVLKWGRFTFPSDFHIVYEGYGAAIYLRGGEP